MDDGFYAFMAGIIIALFLVTCFFLPTGNFQKAYTGTIPFSSYVADDGSYHVKGLISVDCGSIADKITLYRTYDFVVSRDVFNQSLSGNRMQYTCSCENGMITNIQWGW